MNVIHPQNNPTIEDVIGYTINILNGINVPVSLHEQIADPIKTAIGNLNAILESIGQAKDTQAEATILPETDTDEKKEG